MLYESLIHPITILSTLPSAGVGALLALLIAAASSFSIIALIGIILLIGIVKKNAIMMIDFALEAERDEGLDPEAAIHQACLLRFRPILMTTLAALFGALPLALGLGAGSELRRPLGISIVGGLLVSQLLTLFTTPVIYLYLDRLRRPRPARPAPQLHSLNSSAGAGGGGCPVGLRQASLESLRAERSNRAPGLRPTGHPPPPASPKSGASLRAKVHRSRIRLSQSRCNPA